MKEILLRWLLALSVLLTAHHARADDPEAEWQYNQGTEKFIASEYEGALAAFRRAFELSKSPNSALMIAHSLRALDRHVEAARQYTETVKLAGAEEKYARTRGEATQELDRLRPEVAWVSLRVIASSAKVTVSIGDETFALQAGVAWRQAFHPGEAIIDARADGHASHKRTVTLVGGEVLSVPIELDVVADDAPDGPDDADGGWLLPAGIAAVVVAGAGWGLFIGFGVSNRNIESDLETRCAPMCGDADREDADRGETHGTVANIGLGVAAVASTAAAALIIAHLVTDGESESAVGLSASGLTVRW